MKALDSSVLVAALSSWHDFHEAAVKVLDKGDIVLPAHVIVETYSVLTRMPAPFRLAPAVAAMALDNLPAPLIPAPSGTEWLVRLAAAGISGGAVYDALVGLTAKSAGATLVSADRRAWLTYDALGVAVEFLEA